MFGGHEVAPKMTPIELFMAGDILFYNMAILARKDFRHGGVASVNYSRRIGNKLGMNAVNHGQLRS